MLVSQSEASSDAAPQRFVDRTGAEICIRPVRPGESIDLLALALLPRHESSASGSLRPLSRYAGSHHGHTPDAVVAREGHDPDEGRVLGVGALRPVDGADDVGEVLLFVVPERRSCGLGQRLFHHLVEVARASQFRRLRIRLASEDVEALGVMARLSTHATCIPEQGEQVRIEFPTASVG